MDARADLSRLEPGDAAPSRAEDVWVLVVSHNNADALAQALTCIRSQSSPVQATVVVDNASTDGTTQLLSTQPDIHIVALENNVGPAGAFAEGISYFLNHSVASFALLIPEDYRLSAVACERLLAVARADPSPAILGSWVAINGEVFQTGLAWRRGRRLQPDRGSNPYDVDLMTFGPMLVPRSLLEKVGLPRREFFIMWEEYDWCLRARDAGVRIRIVPEVLARTGTPQQTDSHTAAYPPWRGYYQARNWFLSLSGRRAWSEIPSWAAFQLRSIFASLRYDDSARRVGLRTLGMLHGVLGRSGHRPGMP